MERILPLHQDVVSLGLRSVAGIFMIGLVITMLVVYRLKSTALRFVTLILGMAITYMVSFTLRDIPKAVILRNNEITIQHLVSTGPTVRSEDVVALEERNGRGTPSFLVIETQDGSEYHLDVDGSRRLEVAQAIADHLGLRYAPLGERKRWVRP